MKTPAQDQTAYKRQDSNPGTEVPKLMFLLLAHVSALRRQELWLGPGCPRGTSYMVFKGRPACLARCFLANPSPGPRSTSHFSSRESSLCSCLAALRCLSSGPAYQGPPSSLSPLCKRGLLGPGSEGTEQTSAHVTSRASWRRPNSKQQGDY